MGTRLELHGELLELAPHAYYDPPSSVKIQYPCFVYHLSRIKPQFADNRIYQKYPCYMVTYISPSVSDHKIDEFLDRFQYSRFDRTYTADELHHYVFEVFY